MPPMPRAARVASAALVLLAVLAVPAPARLLESGFADRWPGAPGVLTAPADVRIAQGGPNANKTQPKQVSPQQGGKPQPNSPVNLEQALYLIRSTLLTLNDANRSGNYSVLRDLAAPGFQNGNTAADLALIFADLRRRHVDLFAVALMAPQLETAPTLDDNGMLRLSGHFPTQPLQIKFDLLFQNVDKQWRMFGISVQTPEVAPQANIPQR